MLPMRNRSLIIHVWDNSCIIPFIHKIQMMQLPSKRTIVVTNDELKPFENNEIFPDVKVKMPLVSLSSSI